MRSCDTCLHQGEDACRSDTLCDKYAPDEAYIDGRRDGINLAIFEISSRKWGDNMTARQTLELLRELLEAEE